MKIVDASDTSTPFSPATLTASAHKLARILHLLIRHRYPNNASVFAYQNEFHRNAAKKTSANKPPSTASHSLLSRVMTS